MMVAVIGGGASGMVAALTAAQAGHQVCLLERQPRVGRKLLATGNGRCNLTNLHLDGSNYHGQDPAFVRPALAAFGPEDARDFFRSLGLLTVAEDSGRVYPLSDQAGSVLDVLRFALEEAGVDVRTGTDVTAVRRRGESFSIQTEAGELTAGRLIVCCGGAAGGRLGGSRSGYMLLGSLGHSTTRLYPALVQLCTDTQFVRALKGVRADAAAALRQGGRLLQSAAGEVQFTETGVSGPVGFELSRAAATAEGPLTVHLDLLRDIPQAQVEQFLEQRLRDLPHLTLENLLTGTVHNRLGRTVLRYAGFGLAEGVKTLDAASVRRIASALKDFALPVTGVQGFDGAQVTAGGVSTAEFDPETLQSRLAPGLYAAGEVLDVDGDCGGYNLQWAWASGRLAGRLL